MIIQNPTTNWSLDQVELINNNNNNNNNNDNNNKAAFNQVVGKATTPNTSARPVGPTASPEGLLESQKAERGIETTPAPKSSLAQEKYQLQQSGDWFTQKDLAYLSVSFYLNEPNNFDSIKCQYSFKTHGNFDLKSNKFSAKFTRNRYDYIRNIRDRWSDAETATTLYTQVHDCIRQGIKENQYVGGAKSRPVKKFGSKVTTPLIAMGTVMLHLDDEADWHVDIWHHDMHVRLSIPNALWAADLQKWINQYGIVLEGPAKKRPRNVPPFTKLHWGCA